MTGETIVHAMACNNAWANRRLLAACGALSAAERAAPRAGFFPSILLTLRHILVVDWFYVAALEGAPRPFAEFDPQVEAMPFEAVAVEQAAVDRRLMAFCAGLAAGDLDAAVTLPRAHGPERDRVGRVLLHLFQHQVHHRGQVHAMMSGAGSAPPQLDEFFLSDPGEAALRAPELEALGLSESAIWR
jgi:uncharacterized damage-inducible protein DinB